MEKSSYSIDLNPMENIWGILARRVYADNKHCSTIHKLKVDLQDAFNNLVSEILDKRVDSKNSRIFVLIRKNQGPAHY